MPWPHLVFRTAAGASVSTRLDPRALDRISRREADAAVGMRTVWVCMTVVLLLAAVGTFTALTATLDGDPSGVTLREWAAPIARWLGFDPGLLLHPASLATVVVFHEGTFQYTSDDNASSLSGLPP